MIQSVLKVLKSNLTETEFCQKLSSLLVLDIDKANIITDLKSKKRYLFVIEFMLN